MGKEKKELLLCAEVEVEAPSLVEEAVCGGVVDANAEEVREEHGWEQQVEEDDEEPDEEPDEEQVGAAAR